MTTNNQSASSDARFEYKYRLTIPQFHCVRNALKPYMKRDAYSSAGTHGRYLVRSLYFDTYNLRNYEEKVNGDCDRVKLRIRTYCITPTTELRLRAELKARRGIITEKFVCWIDHGEYETFMQNGHWLDTTNPVLAEFERLFHLKSMQPQIIVEYQREGYYARSRENLRITFDHHASSAASENLFPEHAIFRRHHSGMIDFEIKCNDFQPGWLREIIQQNGLRITANSKYVQGIETACPKLVREAWSA